MARTLGPLLLALAFLAAGREAYACSGPENMSEADWFAKSREVFHALVVRTALSDERLGPDNERGLIGAWYVIREVFKGDPARDEPVVTNKYIMGRCGLPLLAGQDYVFFTDTAELGQDSGAGPHVVRRYVDVLSSFMPHPNPEHKAKRLAEIRRLNPDLGRQRGQLIEPPHN